MKYTILAFCFCLIFKVNAQQNILKDELTVLEIVSKDLISILDSVIAFEKQCDYYEPKLFFFINIQSIGKCLIVQIGSKDRIIENNNQLGSFSHKEHLFIVRGKHLESTLFSATNTKKEIEFYEPNESYDPESGEVVVDVIEDDRFSFWVYKYKNGQFIFEVKHTYCK